MSEKMDSSAEALSDREIVTTRVFNAARELVFKAWTDPDHLVHWWGPKGFTNTFQEFDLRPGGIWRFVMHGPDGVDYKNKSVCSSRPPLNAPRSRCTPSRRTIRTSTASRRNWPRWPDTRATSLPARGRAA